MGDGEVEVEGWIGLFSCFVHDYAKGVAIVAAGVGREDASVGCDGDADGPLVVVFVRMVSFVDGMLRIAGL